METESRDLKDTDRRAQEIGAALRKAVEARGHTLDASGRSLIINGERVSWYIYEPSVRRKAPLTKKELKERPYSVVADRGWKYVLEPGGSLTLVIEAEFHSEARIADTRKKPLEARIEAVVDRFEAMAAETVERRKRNEESQRRAWERQKRRQERIRLQHIEDRKWDVLTEFIDDWTKAQRLGCFIGLVVKQNELTPDPSGRIQGWIAWAQASIKALDPLAGGIDGLIERLYPPELTEYEQEFGEPEDIDD